METSGLTEGLIKDYYKQSVNDYINEIKTMEVMKSASHIVAIEDYEVVENDDGIGWTIYIRMELLTNLTNYIKAHPLSVQDVIQLGIDLLTGLEFCHTKRIIHRDIKPSNIFVSPFGEYKLGDFGISKEVERTNATLSQKGTKSYMAPEMISGRKYGKDVDMYALGLTMYELLNHGRMPFLPAYPQPFYPSDRDEAIFKRLSGEEFPDIEGIGELNNILKKACHKEPTKRYQSAHEMKEALEQLINKTENIKQEEKINIDTNAEKTNNNFQKENMKEKVYQDFSERTQNIFNEENGKMNDSYSKEDNFYTVDYERKVIEYVIREFYVKESIDLYRDTMALSRVYDEVKKQLSLSKDYPIIINIPHLIVTNTGVKSLYVKINKEDIQQTTQSTKKTQYTETEKRIRTITNKMSTL